jgi:hypothetical protein
MSDDERIARFFDRLEEGSFKARPPAINAEHLAELLASESRERHFFRSVRALAEHRENVGRDHFGNAYRNRDNLAEAAEEIADFCIYLYLEGERAHAETNERDGADLLLQACSEAISALETAMSFTSKLRGSP